MKRLPRKGEEFWCGFGGGIYKATCLDVDDDGAVCSVHVGRTESYNKLITKTDFSNMVEISDGHPKKPWWRFW